MNWKHSSGWSSFLNQGEVKDAYASISSSLAKKSVAITNTLFEFPSKSVDGPVVMV